MPRIYLAGPDVFRSDASSHFALLSAVCEVLGMEALAPFDELASAQASATEIYSGNMRLLRSADGVIANLAPFRGTEPDSGTVFEVGVAVALGLPVVAYGVPADNYAERAGGQRDTAGVLRDAQGLAVEDFGLPLNLMLSCSVQLAGSSEDALRTIAGLILPRS